MCRFLIRGGNRFAEPGLGRVCRGLGGCRVGLLRVRFWARGVTLWWLRFCLGVEGGFVVVGRVRLCHEGWNELRGMRTTRCDTWGR